MREWRVLSVDAQSVFLPIEFIPHRHLPHPRTRPQALCKRIGADAHSLKSEL